VCVCVTTGADGQVCVNGVNRGDLGGSLYTGSEIYKYLRCIFGKTRSYTGCVLTLNPESLLFIMRVSMDEARLHFSSHISQAASVDEDVEINIKKQCI